ncbi:copper chaperone PCu(A)C [Streptomyces sp. NPDC002324]
MVAPLGASFGTLALLVAYTATGAAGDAPPRITVGYARIVAAPTGSDSAELGVSVIRRTVRRTGTGRTEPAWAVDVPAGGAVRMAPGGLGVVILDPPVLKAGQRVPYTLWFRKIGKVVVRATVTESVK